MLLIFKQKQIVSSHDFSGFGDEGIFGSRILYDMKDFFSQEIG